MQRFLDVPVMGIVRGLSREQLEVILPAYIASGLNTIEITLNTPGATELIRMAKASGGENLQVGAGTIRALKDLETALHAGASFIVTPISDEEVVTRCVQSGIPVFPGAFTPTEIHRAYVLGATMVKVFPASVLGPDYIRNLKAPMPDVPLMPTGGIDLETLSRFKAAGADAYGIGSPLFPAKLIELNDRNAWQQHFESFVQVSRKTL